MVTPLLFWFAPDRDVAESSGLVEGADAYATVAETEVDGFEAGVGLSVDFDETAAGVSIEDEFHADPLLGG